MKKYLKAIGCFAIFVLAVFSYFREQSYKLDSLSLQNVEALAEGEEYTHISCIGVGSLDCPVNHSGVKYIFKDIKYLIGLGRGWNDACSGKV
ncbi:NVEALA domain-containing protein [Bacteroides fragilis]